MAEYKHEFRFRLSQKVKFGVMQVEENIKRLASTLLVEEHVERSSVV